MPIRSHLTKLGIVAAALILSACSSDAEPVEGSQPGDCSDRADNDVDGLFDCDDPGCAGSPDCRITDGGTDTGIADTGAPDTAVPDTGVPECPAPGTLCGASCVELATSVEHCGMCDRGCRFESVCEASSCITNVNADCPLLSPSGPPPDWCDLNVASDAPLTAVGTLPADRCIRFDLQTVDAGNILLTVDFDDAAPAFPEVTRVSTGGFDCFGGTPDPCEIPVDAAEAFVVQVCRFGTMQGYTVGIEYL